MMSKTQNTFTLMLSYASNFRPDSLKNSLYLKASENKSKEVETSLAEN